MVSKALLRALTNLLRRENAQVMPNFGIFRHGIDIQFLILVGTASASDLSQLCRHGIGIDVFANADVGTVSARYTVASLVVGKKCDQKQVLSRNI